MGKSRKTMSKLVCGRVTACSCSSCSQPRHDGNRDDEVRTSLPSPPHPRTVRICAGQRQQHQHQQRKKSCTPREKKAKRRAPSASRRRHWTCAACPSTDVAQRPPAELHTRGAEGFFFSFLQAKEAQPRRDAGEEAVCPFGAWGLAPCPQSMIALHNK